MQSLPHAALPLPSPSNLILSLPLPAPFPRSTLFDTSSALREGGGGGLAHLFDKFWRDCPLNVGIPHFAWAAREREREREREETREKSFVGRGIWQKGLMMTCWDGQDRLVPTRVDPQHFAHAPISTVAAGYRQP